MNERDFIHVQRLIEWIVNNTDYGDITELCNELNVPEEWFAQFYDEFEDYWGGEGD